jgi:phosphoribosylglycinamide formyltransferase 2
VSKDCQNWAALGKPNVAGKRRMGVALARGADIEKAREKARNAIAAIEVSL